MTASLDHTIKLWASEGRLLLTMREQGPVKKPALSAGEAELTVLVDRELDLRRWDLATLHARLKGSASTPASTFSRPRASLNRRSCAA